MLATVTVENTTENPVPVTGSLTLDTTGLATSSAQTSGNASLTAIEVANKPSATVVFPSQVTVGGAGGTTATQFSAQAATQGVSVQALSTNTASVWIGGSDVTTSKGWELAPGSNVFISVANLNLLYHISTTTGQKVNLMVV